MIESTRVKSPRFVPHKYCVRLSVFGSICPVNGVLGVVYYVTTAVVTAVVGGDGCGDERVQKYAGESVGLELYCYMECILKYNILQGTNVF